MSTITWVGEEGSPICIWCGITFRRGEPVEVSDPWMLRKAKGNRFFQVTEDTASPQVSWGERPSDELPPPKRGPGRPRKHPLPLPVVNKDNAC